MVGAEGLPISLVPEALHVPTMRDLVIHYVGRFAAHDARWVLGEVAFASGFPFAVVPTLTGAGALLIKRGFPFPVSGNDVLAAFPGSQDASTGAD